MTFYVFFQLLHTFSRTLVSAVEHHIRLSLQDTGYLLSRNPRVIVRNVRYQTAVDYMDSFLSCFISLLGNFIQCRNARMWPECTFFSLYVCIMSLIVK